MQGIAQHNAGQLTQCKGTLFLRFLFLFRQESPELLLQLQLQSQHPFRDVPQLLDQDARILNHQKNIIGNGKVNAIKA